MLIEQTQFPVFGWPTPPTSSNEPSSFSEKVVHGQFGRVLSVFPLGGQFVGITRIALTIVGNRNLHSISWGNKAQHILRGVVESAGLGILAVILDVFFKKVSISSDQKILQKPLSPSTERPQILLPPSIPVSLPFEDRGTDVTTLSAPIEDIAPDPLLEIKNWIQKASRTAIQDKETKEIGYFYGFLSEELAQNFAKVINSTPFFDEKNVIFCPNNQLLFGFILSKKEYSLIYPT